MSAIEGLGPNLDGAVVDLVSSLAKSGAKKGRFGTPQWARILACWRLAAGICMQTAPAKLVVAHNMACAWHSVKCAIERISKNDAGIDSFRGTLPTQLSREKPPREEAPV